jgi:uncharacterized protein (TIGR02996 family)
MTATAAALFREVLERPEDDRPRLVYADWLDENGEADRAEFIRIQGPTPARFCEPRRSGTVQVQPSASYHLLPRPQSRAESPAT